MTNCQNVGKAILKAALTLSASNTSLKGYLPRTRQIFRIFYLTCCFIDALTIVSERPNTIIGLSRERY